MPVVRKGPALDLGDSSVPWSARLLAPERMLEGSRERVVVEVSGPRPLEGRVRIGVGYASAEAAWEGDPGPVRRASVPLRPPVGVHRVLVGVEARPEAPILDAGKLVVSGR